ncbi:MAG: protein-L-isoaspartate O-methyltransferase [Thermoprotei archaeon]|nr:MAG: protein-L-isoaspartate O-methyltransferase [Thermoprotei archaeon]HDI32056.1 protein-L-isoaspartate(D-aspartate) O-methyltransferase [Thermofilum sp.]
MSESDKARRLLIVKLKAEGVIRSPEVERAMLIVPREEFIPQEYRRFAYSDNPLPILKGQTISAPHMCAMMCEALKMRKGERVLEVGTGSGYHAALCAEIVSPTDKPIEGYVVTLEYYKELAKFAHENLKRTGYDTRVDVIACDGSMGSPTRIKYDKILVTAAAPSLPKTLVDQLRNGGRLVIPIGSYLQQLTLVEKVNNEIKIKELGGCIFVRLRGQLGFKDETSL